MPRNGTGTYTLPRPPFMPGTVISSADVNADLSDIAAALTGSIAANGETSITAQLRGLVSLTPMWSFVGDADTGFGSDTGNQAALIAGGVKAFWANPTGVTSAGTATFGGKVTVTSGGLEITAGGLTITAGGFTVSSGGITITGNSTITGNLTVTAIVTLSSTSHMVVPAGTTAQRPAGAAANFRYNTTTTVLEYHNGTTWRAVSPLSTFTRLTVVGSDNYSPPVGVRRIRVIMTAGGGGGGGQNGGSNGAAGGNAVFESWTAVGGAGGIGGNNSATGGTGGVDGTGTLIGRYAGGYGGPYTTTQNSISGGTGGISYYGGSGVSVINANALPATSYGAGGGGGGGSAGGGGSGGGAGETVDFYMDNPTGPIAYTIPAGGARATGGNDGSDGFQGYILIEEIY